MTRFFERILLAAVITCGIASCGSPSPEAPDIEKTFAKHDGKWKLDLMPNFPQADLLFKKMAADAGMGENEFLFRILTMLSGRQVTDEIWKPLE